MRTPLFPLSCVLLCLGPWASRGVGQPVPLERSAHHTVWLTSTGGSYTELADGLNCLRDGRWVPSREDIELFKDGAVARHGPFQVIFAPNLNQPGGVDLLTPDGQRFQARILGLAYFDAASGKSVLVAELKDAAGQVVPPNQVLYLDAFTDCQADVRFTCRKGSFQQDVILRQAPPAPERFGLPGPTTRLQVWTEFFDPPQAAREPVVLHVEAEPALRRAMVAPDLVDEQVAFGATRLGSGRAFSIETEAASRAGLPVERLAPVAKQWAVVDGRQFLVESVEYPALKPLLDTLPQAAVPQPRLEQIKGLAGARARPVLPRATWAGALPKPPAGPARPGATMQMARADTAAGALALAARKGVVLDYDYVYGTNDFTFRSDRTYLISGPVTLGGTNVLEGGTVLKFEKTGSPSLTISGSGAQLLCRTSPYRPAILTAKDDDSVGEPIYASTGYPIGYYATTALGLSSMASTPGLQHLRIAHAQTALQVAYVPTVCPLSHAQMVHCQNVFGGWYANLILRNVLVYDSTNILAAGSSTLRGEHLTLRQATYLNSGYYSTVYLTNSLLAQIYSAGTYYGLSNAVVGAGAFQTVGVGAHYLAANSPYRNAGSLAINATLLADLRQRTTCPPIVLTGSVVSDTTLLPQAQRDTDVPDLGYHYDPLDYAVSGLVVTNATLALADGVAVGGYGTNGFTLQNGSRLLSTGSPLHPNRLVRWHAVQEQASWAWSGRTNWATFRDDLVADALPEARFRFTEFPLQAAGGWHFAGGSKQGVLALTDCRLLGGHLEWNGSGANGRQLTLINTLFERVTNVFGTGADLLTLHARNNLFKEGGLRLQPASGNDWTWRDNLFDQVRLSQNGHAIANSHNGYTTNVTRLTPTGATDVLLTHTTYQAGPLGAWYYPTNGPMTTLLNAGSRPADQAGLYHYTATTNQVEETNSIVDIGLHYMAVDANGQPVDSDSDGLPDYLEDADGDGTADTGETSWAGADTDGDGVSDYLEVIEGRNPLANGTRPDTGGYINLRVFTPLK
jgi:hypothetical protein